MKATKALFRILTITAALLAQPCFGAAWEGTDAFPSGLSTSNWTLYQNYQGQMVAVGVNGHVSFIDPISSTNREEAIIGWKGTPTAAEDWTVDILGHNNANWSATDVSKLALYAFDTASITTTNILQFGPWMQRWNPTPSCPYTACFKFFTHSDEDQWAPATNSTFGLRVVHRGGLQGTLEAWYDPAGNGTAWTLLQTFRVSDFSPTMIATSTFSIGVVAYTYYAPLYEGDIWADNFRIVRGATGTIPPQTALAKAVKPTFSNLMVGTNYQLQVSADMSTWTNQGSAFTATNTSMIYPQYWDVDNWGKLFFRLQLAP